MAVVSRADIASACVSHTKLPLLQRTDSGKGKNEHDCAELAGEKHGSLDQQHYVVDGDGDVAVALAADEMIFQGMRARVLQPSTP